MHLTWRSGSPDSQFARWLMMVSMAMAVLPVCRSPMISSRWPRPIGVIASMALIPVCSGWFTLLRCTTDGACSSRARSSVPSISPLPSSGMPSGSTTRPRNAVADGHGQHLAGAPHLLALFHLAEVAEDDHADLADVQVEREAADPAGELKQFARHRRGEPFDARDAVAALGDRANLLPGGLVRLVRLDEAAPARRGSRRAGLSAPPWFSLSRLLPLPGRWPHAAQRRLSAASRLLSVPSMSSSPI